MVGLPRKTCPDDGATVGLGALELDPNVDSCQSRLNG